MQTLRGATFFRWITVAALADWLVARSLARLAIFMPKTPPVLAAYQGLVAGGQLASTLCALLGFLGIGWLAWRLRNRLRGIWTLSLACLILMALLFILQVPTGWLLLAYHLILLSILLWSGMDIWRRSGRLDRKIAVLLPVAAISVGSFYQSLPAFYAVLHLPGPAPLSTHLFNLGELLAVLSPIGLWYAYGRGSRDRHRTAIYLIALLPAILFLVAQRLNPSLTAILAIWSTGLTLYLPAWLYALSLWLAGATVLLTLRGDKRIGLAILLLAAAGYAPQLSSQVFLALLALSLLANHWQDDLAHAQLAYRAEKIEAVTTPLNG